MDKIKHKDAKKIIKRNEFAELVSSIGKFASKNTENVIITAVIAVIIVVAIPVIINFRKTNEVKAERLISEANFYINRPVVEDSNMTMYGFFRSKNEKYEKAIQTYLEVISKYRGTNQAPAAYLGAANAYYNNGMYKEALEYYGTFIDKYKSSPLYPEALSGKGYALYQSGNYQEAVNVWQDTKIFESGPNANDVKLKLADCYVKLNDKQKAIDIYKKITEEMKGTFWASVASEKMKEIKL
ncbi:MAG: Outer membrane protein assembly factor BamD [Candidatus Aerophobetes bacterium ADurb.Bin490]|nr:MAG: Outer membrane protein assembly factor BamD [Candidatus Aerophobetes bacterium ADurb.Bin490]HPI02556.1 tetratricopeptide repeat protein [Candidatus Goldiibacteriota bacterium]HPN63883.1 tetratricopeptide repeat protein [Candidatus Goldiibacteriota bacterium]HRQ42926.1 tetratricopeptide repeat protein [Candidatus Goldiibacteriota bacterium]